MSTRAGNARNAVRHGVLAEPDPGRVRELLGHILGDTQGGRALTDSEARLDAARAHYVACQPEDVDPDMADCVNVLEDFLHMDDMLDEDKREAIRRIFRVKRFDARARASRQRLALRYLNEARATRGRALSAFFTYGETAEGDAIWTRSPLTLVASAQPARRSSNLYNYWRPQPTVTKPILPKQTLSQS